MAYDSRLVVELREMPTLAKDPAQMTPQEMAQLSPEQRNLANKEIISQLNDGKSTDEILTVEPEIMGVSAKGNVDKSAKGSLTLKKAKKYAFVGVGLGVVSYNIGMDQSAHEANLRGDTLAAQRIQNDKAVTNYAMGLGMSAVGIGVMAVSGNYVGAALAAVGATVGLVQQMINHQREMEKYLKQVASEKYAVSIERDRFVRNIGEER